MIFRNIPLSFKIVISALLLLCAATPLHAIQTLNQSDISAAESVLQQYFQALAAGQTEEIKNLLGGKQLDNQINRLNNPEYGKFLQSIYSNSKFEIVKSTISGNEIQIDANIIQSEQEMKPIRFHLQKEAGSEDSQAQIRIHNETNLD